MIQPIYLYPKNSCPLIEKFSNSMNLFVQFKCFNYQQLLQLKITVLNKFSGSNTQSNLKVLQGRKNQ